MIDVHLHLLPGVDDGPADLAAALALAQECADTQTPLVVATPHIDDWTRAALPDAASVGEQVAALQAQLREAAIPVQVLPGGEAFLSPELPRQVRAGLVPTLGGMGWLLVEAPLYQKPLYLSHVLFELQAEGVKPLLAHPERYGWLQANPDLLEELVMKGISAQITASSLTGRRGRRQQAVATAWVQRGLVHVIASDRHQAGEAGLHEGYTAAVALVGEEHATHLVDTYPRLIIEGQPLPINLLEEAPRRRWIDRLFRR